MVVAFPGYLHQYLSDTKNAYSEPQRTRNKTKYLWAKRRVLYCTLLYCS